MPLRFRVCLILITLLLSATTCFATSNQFVILSDLHPAGGAGYPNADDQMAQVADEIINLHPAFVIQLGDIGGEDIPGYSLWEMSVIDKAFKHIREAGIEIYWTMGNHDVAKGKEDVETAKRRWLCSQMPPFPLNRELAASNNPEVYLRFYLDKQYYYSFNRGGIHFVIANSNDTGKDGMSPDQEEWLTNDLIKSTSKFPTLIFTHFPQWMTGNRNWSERPLYNLLAKYPNDHTVKAIFCGDWHYGQNFPTEQNLGIQVYATPASVISRSLAEYIVATVKENEIVFEKKIVAKSKKGEDSSNVIYYPIPGKFTDLDKL